MFWEFPSAAVFSEIYRRFPFDELKVPFTTFDIPSGLFKSLQNVNIRDWERVFNNRIFDVAYSFVFALFYFDQRIPDDRWHTEKMDYLPDFGEKDHLHRVAFNYHADTFFYKTFSAIDILGHLLFLRYDMIPKNERGISMKSAVVQLREKNRTLHERLEAIQTSEQYRIANRYRNDYAHNFPVSEIGPGITIKPNRIDIGIGKYTTSREIHGSMQGILECLKEMVVAITESLSPN